MFLRSEHIVWFSQEKNKSGKLHSRERRRLEHLFICDSCGSFFRRKAGRVSRGRLTNGTSHFCDKCDKFRLAQQKGTEARKRNLRVKIGDKISDSGGYIVVYVGDTHPYSKPYGGRIREHILVMELHLGRKLLKNEVIHHIDGNKQNNHLSNLDLCTPEEHNRCHSGAEKLVFEMYAKGLVRYDRDKKCYLIND